jgi:hypothetical protein
MMKMPSGKGITSQEKLDSMIEKLKEYDRIVERYRKYKKVSDKPAVYLMCTQKGCGTMTLNRKHDKGRCKRHGGKDTALALPGVTWDD